MLEWRRLACAAAVSLVACAPQVQSTATGVGCEPDGDLSFVCGAEKPEDLAVVPGTDWLIASGFAPGSGLKLVDTKTHASRRWFEGDPSQIGLDREQYPDCAEPPSPEVFNARGISLRLKSPGEAKLYVVNHGGRESIEVFSVQWTETPGAPRLVWRGCLRLPEGYAGNSVATYSDGTVLTTVLTRPGTTITDFVLGRKTGLVLERSPRARTFSEIPGTSLEGNNGLETSPDDDGFYVVSFGTRQVVRFNRDDPAGPRWSVTAPEFMPDNIHWAGSQLLAAGMVRDEPACGGVRQIVNGVADTMVCHRGYVVALLDPVARSWTAVTHGGPVASFNGVSAALIHRGDLWLGSYQADRIAVRRLPGKRAVAAPAE